MYKIIGSQYIIRADRYNIIDDWKLEEHNVVFVGCNRCTSAGLLYLFIFILVFVFEGALDIEDSIIIVIHKMFSTCLLEHLVHIRSI